ncbi:DEAD/DEAH box helicase, partial [Streptomyces sp. URMC 129]|uniref:DEAD/DEAH box helicase n=1 Tax=Streptomyces sp. URMC 129 TaxID=3423407 RepID=UPI003F1A4B44
MTDERQRRAAIVGYWRAVELFSPQKIPAVSARDGVYAVAPGRALPWEAGHELGSVPLRPGHVWQHVVYGGVYSLERVRDVLSEALGESGEDFDGRMDGESAMFAFTVDDRGCLVPDTPVFSTCAWATGRTVSRGTRPGWLDGFAAEEAAWIARVAELGELEPLQGTDAVVSAGPGGPDTGTPGIPERRRLIAAKHLLSFAHELAEAWDVTDALDPRTVRVRSVAVRRDRAEDAGQQDFLNSFLATDLDLVADALRDDDPGAALAAYLSPRGAVDTAARIDVRQRPDVVLDACVPETLPAGRWPADPRHPLALSQQFAVNTISGSGRSGPSDGLFAVNGPPGTGKTTMLRDCFAHAVVQRATRLAALRLPSEAFVADTKYTWTSSEYTRTVHPLRPDLTGFEMVVASANNGAVENISTEIPARSALGEEWRLQADYFAEQATRLLAGRPAWGAVAARLGNKKNRLEFVNRFWHGKERVTDERVTVPIPPKRGRDDQWLDTGQGLAHLLRAYVATPRKGVWVRAKARFRDALREVEGLRRERGEAGAVLHALPGVRAAVAEAHQVVTRAEAELRGCERAVSAAEAALHDAQRALDEAQRDRQAHRQSRPGFAVGLFTLGKAARTWYRADEPLAARESAAREHREETARACARARHAREQAADALRGARRGRDAAEAELRAAEDTARRVRARWGRHVPDDAWRADETARELSAPWADEEFTRARSELFFAALDLHQAFLRCTARTMYGNLMAAMDAVAGSIPSSVPESHQRAAWQSLFLVVPVVSTTFASLGRVFGRLGRESLGWLFIDEAGQATPQMAVGSMWRARRAVVVGDPLQLEPVVTLPWTAQRALLDEFGVDREWAPGRTSVQRIADRTSPYGTLLPVELPDGSLEAWVGSPLRVHRRCDNPMFAISNAVAYDGLMVYGTPERPPYPYAPGSCWVDVAGGHTAGHWVPEEGRAMRRILERLAEEGGVDLARDAYVISPFRKAADGARAAARGLLPADRIGTVHRTQGKEADVVILVLGTAPQATGARAWAAQRPNLLNVAVSRAKRRLFVIGDRTAWQDQRYFATLAETLP